MSFIKAVCRVMERIAPLTLAEKWDNVGLLLEAPPKPEPWVLFDKSNNEKGKEIGKSILLTIDLTRPVLNEALSLGTNVIISYHPPIFKPLRALTLSDPLQQSLLFCAQAGISVYCPHTALDNVQGGINDWLARGLAGAKSDEKGFAGIGEGTMDAIQVIEGGGGAGRLLKLEKWVGVDEIVKRAKSHLCIQHLQIARPYEPRSKSGTIRSIAICAGSGGDLLRGVEADVYFTGEMQHHDVLAAIGNGVTVILCIFFVLLISAAQIELDQGGHTNTERGYLQNLRRSLQYQLSAEKEAAGVTVLVSNEDRHPLNII